MPLAETQVLARVAAETRPNPDPDPHSDRFHPLPHVVSARAGNATVLMDHKRGTYFTLNEVGGRVWELIGASATIPDIVERLLDEYDVGREQLETDIATTLQQLIGDRLVALGSGLSPRAPERVRKRTPRCAAKVGELKVPSVVRCGLLIFMVKMMLKTHGFGQTMDWIRARVDGLPIRNDVTLEAMKATEYAVALASACYPGRAKCLEQSLTLYWILRARGVDVRFRMGVQPFPFLAHAWVDYRARPLNDVAEHITWFEPLPELLP